MQQRSCGRFLSLILILAWLASSSLFGQNDKASPAAMFKNSSRAVRQGPRITLERDLQLVATNATGHSRFSNPAPGNYMLTMPTLSSLALRDTCRFGSDGLNWTGALACTRPRADYGGAVDTWVGSPDLNRWVGHTHHAGLAFVLHLNGGRPSGELRVALGIALSRAHLVSTPANPLHPVGFAKAGNL